MKAKVSHPRPKVEHHRRRGLRPLGLRLTPTQQIVREEKIAIRATSRALAALKSRRKRR